MKKLILPIICVCCALAMTGCGTLTLNEYSQDIAKLELVQTIGVDTGEQGIRVTAGIKDIKPISADAISVAGAVQRLHSNSAKERVYMAHTKHYILGEQAARNGIEEYLDYIERDMDMRVSTPMFIVKGADAQEIMSDTKENDKEGAEEDTEKDTETDTGEGTADIASTLETLEKSRYLLSDGYVFTCADVARNLLENGCALVAAIGPGEVTENSENTASASAVPAGYAVLKDGRLVDFIDTELVGGVNIFMKKMNPDILEIEDKDGKTMAFKLIVADVDYEPVYEGHDLRGIVVNVKLKAGIEEVGGDIDIYDTEVLNDLDGKISQKILRMGRRVLNKSQELGADFLNFRKKVEIKSPIKFSRMNKSWGEIYPGLDIDLRVTTEIERTYDLLEPVGVGGGEGGGGERYGK